jgi:YggT family protein
MSAVVYIANALLQYLLVTAFLLRVLLPLVRANMRNPLSQAVLRVTNPLVLPFRRILPPIGRMDTASVVALLLVQLVTTLIISTLLRHIGSPGEIARTILLKLILSTIELYSFAIFIYVLLGWIAPATYSPANDLLRSLCEPILRPVRRLIPPIGGLDLTPVFVLIALQASRLLLPGDIF